MDDRRIGIGATMYYPVAVEGGLVSMGDAHSAQGDSEFDGKPTWCLSCGWSLGLECVISAAGAQYAVGVSVSTPFLHAVRNIPGVSTLYGHKGCGAEHTDRLSMQADFNRKDF